MITKLSHATVFVFDQDEALAFYRDKLGFTVRTDMRMDNGFRWLSVSPPAQPDLELVLYRLEPSPTMNANAVAQVRSLISNGAIGLGVFETDDCHATYEDLRARGVKFLSPPQEQPYGIEAIVQDPFGNWFSMTQHRAFEM